MAKPIPLEVPPRNPREELHARLQNAPLEHAEALLAGYEVLQGLHDAGVLELLRGLLGSRDRALQTAVDAARTPNSVRIIRNVLCVLKALGEIDPELFNNFLLAFPEAMRRASDDKETPGVWGLLRQFRDRNLRHGVVAVNHLLRIWGRNFLSGPPSP